MKKNSSSSSVQEEPHHALKNTDSVVPTSVEDDDFSVAAGKCSRSVCKYICDFSRSVGAGSATTRNMRRTDALRERFDDTTLTGAIAPFERDTDLLLLATNPFLQLHKLYVQIGQLLFILLQRQLLSGRFVDRGPPDGDLRRFFVFLLLLLRFFPCRSPFSKAQISIERRGR